ncbi:MAG TPA: glycosyltransferase family 4 protein [Herpetosiphonaceae bacterium]
MRIGIYNRWLATLGGGERVSLDFARALAQAGHSVEIITHQPLDLAAVGRRLALDLHTIALRDVPDSPANERLTAISAEYDLLLNASHGDLFASHARTNLLYVYFPKPLIAYSAGGQPQFARRSARLAPSIVRWIAGVYPPETNGSLHWTWTGRRARLEVCRRWPLPARTLLITLADLRPPAVPPPAVRVLVDGVCIAERADDWTEWRIPLPRPLRAGRVCVVELEVAPWTLRACGIAADDRERGLPLHSVALLGGLEERLAGRIVAQPWRSLRPTSRSITEVTRALDAYQTIMTDSRFAQHWITRRWQRPSEVLYPTVDLDALAALPKRPLIVSVGRFFAGAHNKKHLPMIQAFRALCDAGLTGWEYHLVGGCDLDRPEQRAYLEQVQAAAVGYPIVLHVNAPLDELRRCYGEASIFWHATGYGEDEQRDPDSFEHFGITTIEAMAAGCVPVVIAKAGQLETVVHDESGLLWHTLHELQAQTRRLIDDAALRERLAAGAVERSRVFGFEVFARRVREVVEQGNKETREQGNKGTRRART